MNRKIFVISGQSGVGKGTVLTQVLKKHPDFFIPDSYTTRPPRPETAEKKYLYVDETAFFDLVKKGEILEWEKVHSWLYGTSRKSIQNVLDENKTIIFEIDVRGGINIKKQFKNTCLIFLKYPTGEQFEKSVRQRILKDPRRCGVSEEEIQTRIKTAQKEMAYEKRYDFSVENPQGEPEKAVEDIEKIIQEQLRA